MTSKTKKSKLSTDDKVAIALSESALRSLADEYDLHHSSVASIRHDAKQVLVKHFDEKSAAIGRPVTIPAESDEFKKLRAENERLYHAQAIASVERDYAQLQLKHERERSDEERKRKQLKKKKKRK